MSELDTLRARLAALEARLAQPAAAKPTGEGRAIWLLCLDGSPQFCRWAYDERGGECPALHDDQPSADGWTAHRTEWRRVPRLLYPQVVKDNDLGRVEGNEVVIAGCRIYLDDPGAERPASGGAKVEPHRPVTRVENEAELRRTVRVPVRIRLVDGTYIHLT